MVRPNKKFCSSKCRSRFKSREQYYKDYERKQKRRRKTMRDWYLENKEYFSKKSIEDYHKNKYKWRERAFTRNHRNKIIKVLGNKCHYCGKKGIKEIHHKRYDNLVKDNLNKYCESLLGFCSRKCHRVFHRDLINKNKQSFGYQNI